MKSLTVLYDARCGICRLARQWVENQAKFLAVEFLEAEGAAAHRRYPTLASQGVPEELVVIDDEGGVYRGGSAWVMVLYALEDYREWSLRLGSTRFLPVARQAFAILSHQRGRLSRWLHLDVDDTTLLHALDQIPPAACERAVQPLPEPLSNTAAASDLRLSRLPRRDRWTREFR
ncbi:MAG: DCC1-like thiol-disulfide oxidoreductase family protein [Isosphaeraceae bacterium]